jgi:DNA replication protein DnaC
MESAAEILKKSYEDKSLTNTRTSSSSDHQPTGDEPPPLDPEETGGGRPDCPHCGGLGFYVPDVGPEHPDFGRAVECSCRKTDQDAAYYQRLLRASELGSLAECTFSNFLTEGVGLPRAKQLRLKMAYATVLGYAKNPKGWLVLKGGYGCGKTHLAASTANYCIEHGQPVLFINTPDLLDHLRAAYSPASGTSFDQRFDQVRNAPLLILDDLGSQSNTPWAQEKLYQIFNHRYNARLPTIITTNQELEAIEGRIRSRLVDHRLVQILTIAAPDFRRAGFDESQPDLSTLDLHVDQTFGTFDLRERELPQPEANNLRRAYEAAHRFAEAPGDWLVFNSIAHGNGKTHLAAAIANSLARKGDVVLFISVPDLLDHLRATYSPSSVIAYDRRFNEVKTASVLILDDLGTESATPWAREKLYQLLNYRYVSRKPTVITTAIPIKELDPRLESRMMDENRSTFFVVKAPSYRGKVKARRPPARR